MAIGGQGEEVSRNGGGDCVLQPHQDKMGESVEQFKGGNRVEVSFERDEAWGVWFPATVIKYLSDDNSYLVQYWNRKDGTDQASVHKSTVCSSKIRPQSPSDRKRSFRLSDIVDVFYDFAWTTGVIIKDCKDKKFMVSFKRTDKELVFHETKLRFHMEWVDGRWVDASQARVADNDTPHSRPSKKSKSDNAEVPTLIACKKTKNMNQDPSGQPKAPTDGAASKRPIKMSSLEIESPVGEKNKGENVKEVKKDKVRSSKRKGRPSRFRPLSMQVSESNEKGGEMEHIAPIILAFAQSETNCPPDIIPCEFGKEGSQTSITDQDGQGNDPRGSVLGVRTNKGENVKELVNDTTKSGRKRGRPPKKRQSSTEGSESNTGVKTAEDTAEKGCEIAQSAPNLAHIDQSQTSISDQNGEWNDPSGSFIEKNPNQSLPFERTVPLWDTLESLEIFKSIPQKPHFRPLERSSEECREGLALGHMVTFVNIASKIPELKLDTSASSVESSLKNLLVLEENGFDVKLVRECLNDLLIRKGEIQQLQKDLKACGSEISEYKNKKTDIDKVVEEYDKMLKEIRAKRDMALLEREVHASGLAKSQSTWDEINERIKAVESDFASKRKSVLPHRN